MLMKKIRRGCLNVDCFCNYVENTAYYILYKTLVVKFTRPSSTSAMLRMKHILIKTPSRDQRCNVQSSAVIISMSSYLVILVLYGVALTSPPLFVPRRAVLLLLCISRVDRTVACIAAFPLISPDTSRLSLVSLTAWAGVATALLGKDNYTAAATWFTNRLQSKAVSVYTPLSVSGH